MIRFSHEANNGSGSWQRYSSIRDDWYNISVVVARAHVDCGESIWHNFNPYLD